MKGKNFKLRSGNSPLFKKMGSAPVKDMKTGSYAHKFEDESKKTPVYQVEEEDPTSKGDPSDGIRKFLTEQGKGGKLKKTLKKGADALFAGFTSGLDAVYGTGKVMPEGSAKFSFSSKKDKKDDNSPEDNVKNLT